jgi:hypothetical protein
MKKQQKSHVIRDGWQRRSQEERQKRPLKKAKASFPDSPEPLTTSFLIYGSELAR